MTVNEGTFKGILVGDSELENYENKMAATKENEIDDKAVIYAGIKVNKKEEEILCLPPDHTVFPRVDIEEFDTEMEKCVIKCTWEANKEQRKSEEKKVMEEVTEENDLNDEEPNKLVENPLKSLDFQTFKPTDFKNNKRVIIPEADDDQEEIRRNNLKKELRQVFVKYKKEYCDKSGKLLDNNVSETQLKELKNLKCRITNEELTCGETDKTGKLTLSGHIGKCYK